MSRVILSKYDDGSNHVVVGWDHPAGGAFWTEYATKAEVAAAEAWMEDNGDDREKYGTEEYNRMELLAETEVKREGGMFPGILLSQLRRQMPEELQPLITEQVLDLLAEHSEDPDSGYNVAPIDWTQRGN
jgi:hypothetical protein